MAERRIWTAEEDAALRQVVLQMKITKWKDVVRVIASKFKVLGRTSKQCRQRWHNHLNPDISQADWSEEEERMLFKLHQQHGNKWARISDELTGRSDNCIKNYFYSTLRRGLRRLNKFIVDERDRLKMRQIKPLLLHKIIELSGLVGAKKDHPNFRLIEKCFPLIEGLVLCSKEENFVRSNHQRLVLLINELGEFDRNLVRRKYNKRNGANKNSQEKEEEQQEDQASEEAQEVEAPVPAVEVPAEVSPTSDLKQKMATNSIGSFGRRGSLLMGNDFSRSRQFEDDQHASEAQFNRQLLTSSFESGSLFGMPGFQRVPSDPEMNWTLFTPTNPLGNQLLPTSTLDQSQLNVMLSNSQAQEPEKNELTRVTTVSDMIKLRRRPTLDCLK